MTTQPEDKKFFKKIEGQLQKLVDHFTRPKLPRTVVGFVFDILDSSTLEFVNTLEGQEHKLEGVGIVEIVTLLQFQLIISKDNAVTIIALVEYKKLREIEDEPVVLDIDESDSNIPGASEMVIG